jgi:hypothetical protein
VRFRADFASITGSAVAGYPKKAIDHFKQYDRVWFATGSEIVEAFQHV